MPSLDPQGAGRSRPASVFAPDQLSALVGFQTVVPGLELDADLPHVVLQAPGGHTAVDASVDPALVLQLRDLQDRYHLPPFQLEHSLHLVGGVDLQGHVLLSVLAHVILLSCI